MSLPKTSASYLFQISLVILLFIYVSSLYTLKNETSWLKNYQKQILLLSLPEEKLPISNHDNDTTNSIHRGDNITNSTLIFPEMNRNWSKYNLGDGIIGGKLLYIHLFRDSILGEYAKSHNRKEYVINDFCSIVRKKGSDLLTKLPSTDHPGKENLLVVHLRMGDVLTGIKLNELEDVWNYGVSLVPLQIRNMIEKGNQLGWWQYVRTKCYYSAVLELIPAAVKRVILVGSTDHNIQWGRIDSALNVAYLQIVRQFFEEAGYTVGFRINSLPDDDMVYMSHASNFLSGGGRFSKLANDCVNFFNGTTFPETKGWNNGLNEACAKAPKPDIKMRNYTWERLKWRGKLPWKGIKTFPSESCHSGWEPTCEVF